MEVRTELNQSSNTIVREKEQNHVVFVDGNDVPEAPIMDKKMIDLNARPQRSILKSFNHQVHVSRIQTSCLSCNKKTYDAFYNEI